MSILGTFITIDTIISLGKIIYKLILNVTSILEEIDPSVIHRLFKVVIKTVSSVLDLIESVRTNETNKI